MSTHRYIKHLRHHAARRRAVAGRQLEHGREARDRAPARAAGRGRHRGRLPDRLAGRLRGRAGHRRARSGPRIGGLARGDREGHPRRWDAVKVAERPRIHTVIGTSAGAPEVPDQADAGRGARRHARHGEPARDLASTHAGADVEFCAKDAGRAEPEFLAQVLRRAVEAARPPSTSRHDRLRAAAASSAPSSASSTSTARRCTTSS